MLAAIGAVLAAGTLATGAVAGAVEGFAGAATTTVGATVAGVGALETFGF